MSEQVIIYDTEYTTWPGALQNGWSEPWQHREIVQIGAIRIDLGDMREIDTLDILIRPVRNPQLSDYFTQLTGITQAQVDMQGMNFPDAYHRFMTFCGGLPRAAYGNDAQIVRDNLRLHAMPASEDEFSGLDIGPWFMTHGAAYGVKKGVNSGKLAATVGAPIPSSNEHNAVHDARSIAAAYGFLIQKGADKFFK